MKKVKLIWDFRGPNADKIAEHHEIHLNEFILTKHLEGCETGVEQLSEMFSIAFIIVDEKHTIPLRDALKPHRGELVDE
ncbi:MAG: hypothetical protein KDC83_13900 [Flavobacteriales bacterium]|nr:hypothetical protein [Flavobacteriales bacterium]